MIALGVIAAALWLGVVLSLALWPVLMLRRNEALHAYRRQMLEWMRGLDSEAFLLADAEYVGASYRTMLYKFWRSFDSFYPRYAAERRASAKVAAPRDPQRDSVCR